MNLRLCRSNGEHPDRGYGRGRSKLAGQAVVLAPQLCLGRRRMQAAILILTVILALSPLFTSSDSGFTCMVLPSLSFTGTRPFA